MSTVQQLPAIPPITEPLALRSSGDPAAFNEAVERNVQDMHDMGASLNGPWRTAWNDSVEAVNALLGNMASVDAVTANMANVNTVAGISAKVTSVADIQADVSVAADNAAHITACVDNMTGILAAPAQASAAAASADSAAQSAQTAAAKADEAEASAQTSTTKAGEAADSATAANNAKAGAETAKADAETARTGAEDARDTAIVAKTDAQAAKAAAATSADNAAASVQTAATKAGEAATSAAAAAASAIEAANVVLDGVPDASASTKGVVKVGTGMSVASGVISADFGDAAGAICEGNDARLSDARTPTAHAASHQAGGNDEMATTTPTANAIPMAGADGKLDAGWIIPAWAVGDIKLWYGELDSTSTYPVTGGVPDTRWHVCNGTGGTPDMRDKVPMGASSTKSKGSTGGAATHTHTISASIGESGSLAVAGNTGSATPVMTASCASHTAGGTVGATTLTVAQMPSHNHVLNNKFFMAASGSTGAALSDAGTSTSSNVTNTGGSGSHTHTFSGTSHNHNISVSGGSHIHSDGSLAAASHTHSMSAAAAASPTLPPYVALHYLMYTGG